MRILAKITSVLMTFVVWCCETTAQPVSLPAAPHGVETFRSGGVNYSRVRAADVQALIPANQHNYQHPIGGGSWDFGISRAEITISSWIEFTNAFGAVTIPADRPWSFGLLTLLRGDLWSAPGTYFEEFGPAGRPIYQVTDDGAARPMAGVGWYGAAVYCNWLHNNREVSLDALNHGAYDLRAWDWSDGRTWDGVTREAGARYWIPSYDEWAVASFYDRNRFGPESPGWWQYLNRRTSRSIPGPPGEGGTSAGWTPDDPTFNPIILPVASYPDSQSPWGLLDTSGTFREIIENQWEFGLLRLSAGSQAGPTDFPDALDLDEQPGWTGADSANSSYLSFRIATSVVPAPATGVLTIAFGVNILRRRRTA